MLHLRRRVRHLGLVLSDARWWRFYLQRRFMGVDSRRRWTELASQFRPRRAGPSQVSADVQQKVAELNRAGIAHFGTLLTEAQTAELRDYFSTKLVSDAYRAEHGQYLPDSADRHPESHTAHHDPRDVVMAPHLFALANRPDILEIVACYLGCRPTLSYMTAWWSYRTSVGPQHAENFHRDVDDWRFLKLFVYLTDVGPDNGPHVYVSGSAASPLLREVRRYEDTEVSGAFGAQNVLTIGGRSGAGFLEDTFGFHKGQPVMSGRRLMFSVTYSMFTVPYGPKRPVASIQETAERHRVSVDPWINRLYLH